MLKVTVDLVPGGAEALRRTIGMLNISNISELADLSNYQVNVTEAANHLPARLRRFGLSQYPVNHGDRASGNS